MSSAILALDLEGTVNIAARCETPPGMAIHCPGSLVRSRLTHLHTWLTPAGQSDVEAHERILDCARHWGLDSRDCLFAILSPRINAPALDLVVSLGGSRVWLPRGGHAVSPRGLAPAEVIRDYREVITPPTGLNLPVIRDRYVSLMERAAEDVQALGLEQDDSFFDRFADVRPRRGGRCLVLPMETLTDAEWVVTQWRQAFAFWYGLNLEPTDIEIFSLHLRCVMDRPDHGFRAPEHEQLVCPPNVPDGWNLRTFPTGHLLSKLKPA